MPEDNPLNYITFYDKVVLRFIWERKMLEKNPPTIQEIMLEMEKVKIDLKVRFDVNLETSPNSTGYTRRSLIRLEKSEYIERDPHQAIYIKLLKESLLPPIIPEAQLEETVNRIKRESSS